MGKYRSIPRTEGVSTTDIVGRMLLCTSDHHVDSSDSPKASSKKTNKRSSQFYTTTSLLNKFLAGTPVKKEGAEVVYIDGTWDMFHAGHVATLKKAKALGDYLIVSFENVFRRTR